MSESPTAQRIICVTTKYPHRHIESVGVGTDPKAPTKRLTVTQVRSAIDNQQVFYTVSPSTGKIALVRKDTCAQCDYKMIRSRSDAAKDNNLDNLTTCS